MTPGKPIPVVICSCGDRSTAPTLVGAITAYGKHCRTAPSGVFRTTP